MTTYKFEDLLKQKGVRPEEVVSFGTPEKTDTESFGAETFGDIKQAGSEITSAAKQRSSNVGASFEAYQKGDQGLLSTATQLIGQSAGLGSDVFAATTKGLIKLFTGQEKETAISDSLKQFSEGVAGVPAVQSVVKWFNTLDPETQRNLSAAGGLTSLITDVATLGGSSTVAKKTAGEVLDVTGKIVTKTRDTLTQGFETGLRTTSKLVEKISPPKPSALEATGQILQGTTDDVATGVKALSTLDTKGVKTFSQLDEKISTKISDLAKKVDEDLGVDPTKKTLKDLAVSEKTQGGKVVKSNPVQTALNQLEELYTKIGDNVGAANIKEVLEAAKKTGLTRLEINDIARTYGREFGSKAFGKLGEPLTSVNAKLYENTRKMLKDLARAGIKGKDAQKADKLMSSLYNTQTLIERNVQAVNKLKQRINERGLLEKLGHTVSKYGDILTGGTIRGFVGGLLPRGAGYKVLNALDIEKALESNLKILQDAIKSGSNKEIEEIIKKLAQ